MSSAALREPGAETRGRPVSGSTVSQAGERRSARIESLRALAALAVLACHGWAFSNVVDFRAYHSRVILGAGFLGVDVFFALSGYLIFLPFARRDYGDGPRIHLRSYAINRALRILPLYYVVLIVVAVADAVALSTFLRFAVFGQSFREDLVAKALDGPMWSLVVELHFYILLPLFAWGLARLSRSGALRAAFWLLGLAAASVAVYEASFPPAGVWTFSLPANFFFFVPGMLIALLRARHESELRRWLDHPLARVDLWLGIAVVIWLLTFADANLEFRLLPLAALGALLVLAAVVLPLRHSWIDPIFNSPALAGLGVASYSLYLWHWPLMKWLPHPGRHGYSGWLLFMLYAAPVCIAVALLSYRIVERPPLRLRRRWFTGPTRMP